jgi:hypothetical protein
MIARNPARREPRPKLRLYCVEHIDAGRLYERAMQPWRGGLAWRYTAAEARVINEIAKRRWPSNIIGPAMAIAGRHWNAGEITQDRAGR